MGGINKCKIYEIFCAISQNYINSLCNHYKLKAFAYKKNGACFGAVLLVTETTGSAGGGVP